MPEDPRYAVVGGGLAGLAAAEALVRAGNPPLLYEQRRELGGRATSFRDPATGWLLENGQHVWMPCCSQLVGLLQRTGAEELTTTQPRLRMTFTERGRVNTTLQAVQLPAPFHLLLPLLRFPLLRLSDSVPLVRALATIKIRGNRLIEEGSEGSFLAWLRDRGQTDRAIEVFWEPVVTSIVNESLSHMRLDLGVMAVKTSFLAGSRQANLAMCNTAHGLVWDRIADHLEVGGATVHRSVRVERLEVTGSGPGEEGRVRSILLDDGERIPVKGVVVAVPPGVLPTMLPEELNRIEPFNIGSGLEWSPILNVHVWYEERVTDEPVLCVLGSPLHWIFAKPEQEPVGGRRPVPSTAQHLNLVVSASRDFLGSGPDEIVPLLLEEVATHIPAARAVRVVATRVVHEQRATFRAIPGSEAFRPSQATPISNLAIAGAWTATGWPSTLEGAVRSGRAAVRALGVKDD